MELSTYFMKVPLLLKGKRKTNNVNNNVME